jgi:hypothetical protein
MDKVIFKKIEDKNESFSESKITRRTIRSYNKKELVGKYGKKCGYCGCEMVDSSLLDVDSYLPFRTHTEEDRMDNFVLSCPVCNRIKGGKEPIVDGKKVILHPYKDDYWKLIKIDSDGYAYGTTDEAKCTVDIMQLNRTELVAYRINNVEAFIEKFNDGKKSIEVYEASIKHIKKLMNLQMENQELIIYYYRLLYANVIASLEAYLSKTIIMHVLKDEEIFWQFVKNFDWNKERCNIADIREVYNNMEIKVQTALTEVLYHNLPKVKKLYSNTLNIDILNSEEDMEYLCKAVDIRHDIVHRNGRKTAHTKKDEYHVISIEILNDLILNVDKLIKNIEEQILIYES